MPPSATTPSTPLHVLHGLQACPMPPDEAEAVLEAALLAGAEGGNTKSREVGVFLAMSAGVILERMQAAGLAVVRTGDAHD